MDDQDDNGENFLTADYRNYVLAHRTRGDDHRRDGRAWNFDFDGCKSKEL